VADRAVSVPIWTWNRGAIGQIFSRISLITLIPLYLSIKFGRITHVGRGVFLGGQPRPYRNWGGAQRSPILVVPFYLCKHLLTQNYWISTWQHLWRRDLFLSVMPPRQGDRVPALPNFGGLCIGYTLCRRTTKFDMVTHVGGACILGSATYASHPKRAELWLPNYWGSPVYMPTPFNAERPNLA